MTVNGKPIEDLKGDDISVNRHKIKDGHTVMAYNSPGSAWSYNWNDDDNFKMLYEDGNTAMLGVVTESDDDGLRITDITEGSGADKAGLKEDDIITQVNGKAITSTDDLKESLKDVKKGDKVKITYKRNNQTQTVDVKFPKELKTIDL